MKKLFPKNIKKILILPLFILLSLVASCSFLKASFIELYCFHSLNGKIAASGDISTLTRIKSYMDLKTDNPNQSILLSTGDTFNGTYDSATNNGNLIAKALPLMGVEAMTLGNHDFDFGIKKLKENKDYAGSTSFLGANVYYYDNQRNEPMGFARDLCDEYKVIERDGRRIGVIGIIAPELISSISSSNTKNITFLDSLDIVTKLSNHLKTKLNCDAVVLLAHEAVYQMGSNFTNTITSISSFSKKRYVDVVFTGQSNNYEDLMINGVPFIQSGTDGNHLSKVTLDFTKKNVAIYSHSSEMIGIPSYSVDSELLKLQKRYLNREFYNEKSYKIGRIVGSPVIDKNIISKIEALAIYDYLPTPYDDVDVIILSPAYKDLDVMADGGVNNGIIYDSLPYSNKAVVAQVKGKDILRILRHNSKYTAFAPEPITIKEEEIYKIASNDFLLAHINQDRNYDNFPSFNGNMLYKSDEYLYTIFADYMYDHYVVDYTKDIFKCPCFNNIRNL